MCFGAEPSKTKYYYREEIVPAARPYHHHHHHGHHGHHHHHSPRASYVSPPREHDQLSHQRACGVRVQQDPICLSDAGNTELPLVVLFVMFFKIYEL
ncbi:hypothetical protein GGTG_05341 [Gaeumannomyces tritici R3-111a-1]|uniref:Uncharacterized protein n=1 Tax=Gaeumannomyces tritici (strain R3-111a-1) TaxID=644352 RepID=J3NVM6_GAET3|nr:hypothetical protein GGTG_05341 [Gaeumannomyces tritici R3-111a-1]EJT75404.1 hypothetical protein GGTG_05341 [Gaeumannomyces tritici R3-111a-1]